MIRSGSACHHTNLHQNTSGQGPRWGHIPCRMGPDTNRQRRTMSFKHRLNCIHKRVVLLQPTLSCGHQSRKEYAGGIRHFLGYSQVLIPTVPYLSIECILVCKQKWQLQENHLTLTGESTLSYLFCFTGLPMHCPRFTSQTFMVLK